jgi:hypothetical protein
MASRLARKSIRTDSFAFIATGIRLGQGLFGLMDRNDEHRQHDDTTARQTTKTDGGQTLWPLTDLQN